MNKKKGKILIVDDNSQILNSLKILLKQEFEEIITSRNPNLIPGMIQSTEFDIILLDMNFKAGQNTGNEGIFWLREILKIDSLAVVIMITAYGDIELAVKAVKEGATDFISKPWDAEKLLVNLKNAVELRKSKIELNQLRSQQKQLSADIEKHYQVYPGVSKVMQEIYRTVDKVAQTDANVLLLGESGTGKELIAREIHRRSPRSNKIFLCVDMGSLGETLFESELFGHTKGSFTDAKEDRTGRLEIASGGTLFMDEIGNLSMNLQVKLLTVLQSRQVTRIGSNRPIPIDIRLISATNKSLEDLIHQNLFREDLLYRINTIQIELPPLRDRKEDIPGMTDFFLSHYSGKYEKPMLKLSRDAYNTLVNYTWPGNIRELKHTIEKAVILCESNCLKPEDLYLKEKYPENIKVESTCRLSDIEKKLIETVLEKCKGNLSKTAQILDISRTTLYSKIEKYGLM